MGLSCEHCGEDVVGRRKGARYCSPRCAYTASQSAAYARRKAEKLAARKPIACAACESPFVPIGRAKRCTSCRSCKVCGSATSGRSVYCSATCKKRHMGERFVAKCRLVHGNKYDYSKVDYKASHHPVEIVCKRHGPFWQEANNHVQGSGCKKCVRRTEGSFSLYFFHSENKLTKVGVSKRPIDRLLELDKLMPFPVSEYWAVNVGDYREALLAERVVHEALEPWCAGLRGYNAASEWYAIAPREALSIASDALSSYQG